MQGRLCKEGLASGRPLFSRSSNHDISEATTGRAFVVSDSGRGRTNQAKGSNRRPRLSVTHALNRRNDGETLDIEAAILASIASLSRPRSIHASALLSYRR